MIIKPPASYKNVPAFKIFLAGSIDMGSAEDWQRKVEQALDSDKIIILNPRRDDWDSSWKQEIGNKNFFEQVDWEMEGVMDSNLVLLYFAPGTKAPITMFELGLGISKHNKLIVCAPEGFWRKGNIDIVCHKFGIPQVSNLDELISEAKKIIKKH